MYNIRVVVCVLYKKTTRFPFDDRFNAQRTEIAPFRSNQKPDDTEPATLRTITTLSFTRGARSALGGYDGPRESIPSYANVVRHHTYGTPRRVLTFDARTDVFFTDISVSVIPSTRDDRVIPRHTLVAGFLRSYGTLTRR